jgi:hypothetical protein
MLWLPGPSGPEFGGKLGGGQLDSFMTLNNKAQTFLTSFELKRREIDILRLFLVANSFQNMKIPLISAY